MLALHVYFSFPDDVRRRPWAALSFLKKVITFAISWHNWNCLFMHVFTLPRLSSRIREQYLSLLMTLIPELFRRAEWSLFAQGHVQIIFFVRDIPLSFISSTFSAPMVGFIRFSYKQLDGSTICHIPNFRPPKISFSELLAKKSIFGFL